LVVAAAEPELAPVVSGLAVAGFDGTLSDRFTTAPSDAVAGVLRAKTGTLTGISAEAGITRTCAGAFVAYAFVADDTTDTELARDALDDAAAALSTCP
jgi:D-alanyl-D-alanine carboxypeptidase/D-alanyl-D-alanine-endopeptidase (penicillin-binding protein 4)